MSLPSKLSSKDLESYLNNGSFPATGQSQSAASGTTPAVVDNLLSWVDAMNAEGSQSISSEPAAPEKTLKLQRLNLLKQISELAKGNNTAIAGLLTAEGKLNLGGKAAEVPSRSQLARRQYYNVGKPVQAAMFEAEPLGVLLAMIDEDQIMEKSDPSLRKAVIRGLELATGKVPQSVASPEFRAAIYSPQFFEGIPTETFKTEKSTAAEVVLEMVKALQRLLYLVRDPEHVIGLFDEKLRSAHDVAVLSKQWFVDQMVKIHNIPNDAAKRIHDHAINIDCRNQETWVQILSSLKNDFVVGVKKPAAPSQQTVAKHSITGKAYNLTDMFNLQFNECEDCCSVTGLSAYFHDLMQFLESMPLKSAPQDKNLKGNRTVLEALTARRPDLENLEISCVNSTKKISYVTLVIEVLESYIGSLLKTQSDKVKLERTSAISIRAFNEVDTSTTAGSRAITTGKAVPNSSLASPLWSDKMVSQLFPFQTFPYSLARDTIETSLSNFDLSIKKIFSLFGPGQHLIDLQSDARAIAYRRAKASATLGLSQEDFNAITGKKVYTADPPLQEDAVWTGPAVHTMWGYVSKAEMVDTDEAAESGLCFVQKQLLPRSGVSFSELLELLQTLYFGGRLVLVNKKEEKTYESSAISELRLRALNRSGEDKPIVTSLDDDDCIELQAFLRLKARTGWAISDLDAAISTISQRLVNSASTGSPHVCGRGISANIIEELGTISDLSDLVSKPVAELLPLWGTIGTRGPRSLYQKICFTAAAEKIPDPVFRIPASESRITAMPLRDGDEMWKHKPVLQAVLRISADGLEDLRNATGLAGSKLTLSLQSFTTLYRYQTLCGLLKIKPKALSDLCDALPAGLDICQSPAITLRFTSLWYRLLEDKWTSDDILRHIKKGEIQDPTSKTEIKSATWSLAAALSDVPRLIESDWRPKGGDSAAPSSEDIDYICNLVLGGSDMVSKVSKVSQFIQGVLETSTPAPQGCNTLPPGMPSRIQLTKTLNDTGLRLTLNGLLSKEEKRKTFELLNNSFPSTLDLIKQLDNESIEVVNTFEQSSFYRNRAIEDTVLLKQLNQALALDAYCSSSLSADDFSVLVERLRQRRSSIFLQFALPQLQLDITQRTLSQNLGAWCEKKLGNNKELSRVLLDSLSVRSSDGSSSDISTLTTSLSLNQKNESDKKASSSVVLFPPSVTTKTEVYLYLPLTDNSINLKVDGVPVAFEKLENSGLLKSGPLRFNTMRQSIDPKTRSSMQLDFGADGSSIENLTWASNPTGTETAKVLETCAVTSFGDISKLITVFEATHRAISIITKLKLSSLDLRVLLGPKSLMRLDFAALTLEDLAAINSWKYITQEAITAVRTPDFTSDEIMFEFLNALQLQTASISNDRDLKSLITQLCSVMGWTASTVTQVFSERYKQLSTQQIFEGLKGTAGLAELADLARMMKEITRLRGKVPVPLLFQIFASDQPPGGSQETYESIVRGIQSSLTDAQRSTCEKDVSGRKRRALVDFLLQQEHIRNNLAIVTPDGLYEHLLIDVQMGPELETTRMKQAVSTIQLFVQRCLMGLEVPRGVASSDIRQSEWAWRQQHSVWQAARRVFLYPENWLEPSIRDDKTPLFQEFESRIQQQDLTWDSFVASIKGYAQGLSEIADLDIQAYLRQNESGSSDIYHLFGRTRNAPYTFYYRRMKVNRTSVSITSPKSIWSAWNRMELDTLTYETDWNGNTLPQSGTYMIPLMRRNRLFLYLPQISIKTASSKVAERTETVKKDNKDVQVPATYVGMSKTPIKEAAPQKYWEIRMAWTEFSEGKWSPKRLSQSSLVVQANPNLSAINTLPSIGSFIFETLPSKTSKSQLNSTTPDETLIRVGCWNAPGTSYYSLGSFSIKDDRVAVVPALNPNDSLGDTLLTTFHKYSWSDNSLSEEGITPPGEVRAGADLTKPQLPLLAVPYGSKTETRRLTWTLSFGGDSSRDVTGMFVDDVRGNKRSATVFMWPTSAEGIPADFPSSTVVSQSKTVTIIHNYATRLVEATSRLENSVDDLFQKIQLNTSDEGPSTALTVAATSLSKTSVGDVSQEPQLNTSKKRSPAALDFGSEITDKFAAGRHELTTPYAIYNWELGLHTVLLAVERFQATQQFDLALRALKFIFDPTADALDKLDDPNAVAVECWKFPPFKEVAAMKEKMRDGFSSWPDNLAGDAQSSDLSMATTERRSNPLNAHATARGRTQAYMKWVIFKYVAVLVSAGDAYFRRGSLEALPIAIQRYVEAGYILGPAPQKVAKLGQRKAPLTFATFTEEADLELEFPFLCALSRRGSTSAPKVNGKEQTLLCLIKSSYFCLPANPKYQSLHELVEDRFYKTRNNLDINGRPIVYSIDEPYLDPGQLLSGYGFTSGAGGVLDLLSGSQNAPVPYARFQVLVGRAIEMCNDVRGTMEQLLAVREKRDGEALALLRARQDVKKQDLILGLKRLGYEELDITLESLQLQRESNVTQLTHYLKLLGEDEKKIPKDEKAAWEDIVYEIDKPTSDHLRMNRYEQSEFEEAQKSADLTESSSIRDEIVSGLRMLPSIGEQIQPMGMGVTMRIDSHLVADALEVKSKIDRVRAMIATHKSQRAGRMNGLTRQLQERALQANIKGREIQALDKQIAAQRKRLELNQKEQALQEREIEWSNEVQVWYQDKFSSEKLYAFMENQLRGIAYDIYHMALDLARVAERAFLYERPAWSSGSTGSGLMAGSGKGISSPKFLKPEEYWQPGDNGGIFASQRLAMDLRRMQMAYIEKPSYDYQISKTVSLRQIDPVSLTRLQEAGTTTFKVPELYFDMDFPGHYMRRLKSVAVSIPALVGPYTSIAASLTLASHKYRVNDIINDKAGDGAEDSSQFRTDQTPITAIAVSSGYQDAGVFDMVPGGENLAPFEGAGVISSWRIDLPKTAIRQFDYRTISDVVLHMKYTSLQGGPKLRQVATNTVNDFVAGVSELASSDGLLAMFSLKADLSNEWHSTQSKLRKMAKATPADATPLRLALSGLQGRMPFWTRGSVITVGSVSVVISYAKKITQVQAEEDSESVKLATSECPEGMAWESTEAIERSALLTKDGLTETKLDDDWELLISPTLDASNISMVIKYSMGQE